MVTDTNFLLKKKTKLKEYSFMHNFAKFIIDGAKLCLRSVVIGTVIRGEIPAAKLIIGGIIATSVSVIIGILILINTTEN